MSFPNVSVDIFLFNFLLENCSTLCYACNAAEIPLCRLLLRRAGIAARAHFFDQLITSPTCAGSSRTFRSGSEGSGSFLQQR